MRRLALITGVAGGIGSATARAFAEVDWRVVGVDRGGVAPPAELDRFFPLDVTEPHAWERMTSLIAEEHGGLDAVVHNAAVQLCKPLVETLPEEWDEVMNSNLRAVYLGVRATLPLLRQRGGAIINISSVHAIATSANIAAYAASKGALLALTRVLAIELAPYGIRVNAVLPGAVDTPMLRAGLSREQGARGDTERSLRALGERHLLGQVGHPTEVAQAILFLADSDRSSFVTGHALVVDGGATTRLSTE